MESKIDWKQPKLWQKQLGKLESKAMAAFGKVKIGQYKIYTF
jgi:hypothetical protein